MKKILFVSATNFVNDTFSGGKKASLRNYQVNEKIFGNENIDVIIFGKNEIKSTVGNFDFCYNSKSKFETMLNCFRGYTRGYTKFCENYIIQKIKKNNYDYIWIDFSGYGVSINRIKECFSGKIITFFHNVEYYYELNRANKESILYKISANAIKKAEKNAIEISDYIIAISDRDSDLINELYGRKPDIVLNASFKDIVDEDLLKHTNIEDYLLFVGADFGPNVDGIKWFCKNVMPKIKNKLLIVGKGMEKYRAELNSKNIEVIGTVADLSVYYYKAAAVVMPIRYGDGMKIKTAEALMYGRTVFGTAEAFVGYDIEEGKEGYICNTVKEFIEKIEICDKKGYNVASRNLYKGNYSLESSVNKYKCICKV